MSKKTEYRMSSKALREHMEEHNLSNAEMGRRIGRTSATISLWLTNDDMPREMEYALKGLELKYGSKEPRKSSVLIVASDEDIAYFKRIACALGVDVFELSKI